MMKILPLVLKQLLSIVFPPSVCGEMMFPPSLLSCDEKVLGSLVYDAACKFLIVHDLYIYQLKQLLYYDTKITKMDDIMNKNGRKILFLHKI